MIPLQRATPIEPIFATRGRTPLTGGRVPLETISWVCAGFLFLLLFRPFPSFCPVAAAGHRAAAPAYFYCSILFSQRTGIFADESIACIPSCSIISFSSFFKYLFLSLFLSAFRVPLGAACPFLEKRKASLGDHYIYSVPTPLGSSFREASRPAHFFTPFLTAFSFLHDVFPTTGDPGGLQQGCHCRSLFPFSFFLRATLITDFSHAESVFSRPSGIFLPSFHARWRRGYRVRYPHFTTQAKISLFLLSFFFSLFGFNLSFVPRTPVERRKSAVLFPVLAFFFLRTICRTTSLRS